MAASQNQSPKRKRGRPRTDRTPSTDNPAFRRVRAAAQIQAELYLAACNVCDGRPHAEVTRSLRKNLASLAPLARDLKPNETASFFARWTRASAASATTIKQAGGSEKWAESATGPLLGHGPHWYGDAVRRSPWPPAKRRRYSPAPGLRRQMKRHPGRFDRFTPEERCFLRLPSEARTAIELKVRAAWQDEMETWALALAIRKPAERKDFPIVDYFARGPKDRRALRVPPSLVGIVRDTVGRLDKKSQAAVRGVCRRYLAKGRLDAARLTGKLVRGLGLSDDDERGGGRRRGYVDVTPLPVLGRPAD